MANISKIQKWPHKTNADKRSYKDIITCSQTRSDKQWHYQRPWVTWKLLLAT